MRVRTGATLEDWRDVRRERNVMIEDRNVMSNAQNSGGLLGVLQHKPGDRRVRGHEAVKAGVRVVQSSGPCNFHKPARSVLLWLGAGYFPSLGGGCPFFKFSFFSSSSWIRFASSSASFCLAFSYSRVVRSFSSWCLRSVSSR